MTLEDPSKKRKTKSKPDLKVLRGGKFDETPFLKRIDKILPKVMNTDDKQWLLAVFNRYQEILEEEDLKPEEADKIQDILVKTVERLDDLGCTFSDELNEKRKA